MIDKAHISTFEELKAARKEVSKKLEAKKADLKSSSLASGLRFISNPSARGILSVKGPSRNSLASVALKAAVGLVRLAKRRI